MQAPDPVHQLRSALTIAKELRSSKHPLVARVGTRMVAIVVETLYEIDPKLTDRWKELE